MTVYILCYFNNNKTREENFYVNLDQYLKLNYKVVLYWMNKQECRITSDNLRIIPGDPIRISIVRNILLNMFYETEDDYAIFSDDDVFLKSEITEIRDCICFTNDYSGKIKENGDLGISLLLLRNFRKAYNIRPCFDENLDACDDYDFGLTLKSLGIKVCRYPTDNVVIYRGQSSMFTNGMNKLYKNQMALNYISNKNGRNQRNIRDTKYR